MLTLFSNRNTIPGEYTLVYSVTRFSPNLMHFMALLINYNQACFYSLVYLPLNMLK